MKITPLNLSNLALRLNGTTKTLLCFLIYLLGSFQNFVIANATPNYNVEVVVFSQNSSQYYLSEKWANLSDENKQPSRFIDFKKSSNQRKFKRLNSHSKEIKDIISSIKKSSRYELLITKIWRQPGLPKGKAIPVEISSDLIFSYDSVSSQDKDNSFHDAPSTKSKENKLNMVKQLSGFITIELGRFLHIYSDLTFYSPIKKIVEEVPYKINQNKVETLSTGNDETVKTYFTEIIKSELIRVKDLKETKVRNTLTIKSPFTTEGFRLISHRKTRSNELQYIDHPLFGMIVKITPVKLGSEESLKS